MSTTSTILFLLGSLSTPLLYFLKSKHVQFMFASTYIAFLSISALTYWHSQYFNVTLTTSLPAALSDTVMFGLGVITSLVWSRIFCNKGSGNIVNGLYVPDFTASVWEPAEESKEGADSSEGWLAVTQTTTTSMRCIVGKKRSTRWAARTLRRRFENICSAIYRVNIFRKAREERVQPFWDLQSFHTLKAVNDILKATITVYRCDTELRVTIWTTDASESDLRRYKDYLLRHISYKKKSCSGSVSIGCRHEFIRAYLGGSETKK